MVESLFRTTRVPLVGAGGGDPTGGAIPEAQAAGHSYSLALVSLIVKLRSVLRPVAVSGVVVQGSLESEIEKSWKRPSKMRQSDKSAVAVGKLMESQGHGSIQHAISRLGFDVHHVQRATPATFLSRHAHFAPSSCSANHLFFRGSLTFPIYTFPVRRFDI